MAKETRWPRRSGHLKQTAKSSLVIPQQTVTHVTENLNVIDEIKKQGKS